MTMTRTKLIAILFVLLAAVSAFGDPNLEDALPGESVYLVVLGQGAKEPDVAAMGGRVLRWWADRRLVAVSPEVAEALRSHAGVAYVQRIWTGEALATAPPRLQTHAAAMETTAAAPAWTTGVYAYDPNGNIKSIGADLGADALKYAFKYDSVGRVVHASAVSQARSDTQSYRFDPYGNLLQLGDRELCVDQETNRLEGQIDAIDSAPCNAPGKKQPVYDAVGNITEDPSGRKYRYDALGMVTGIKIAPTDTVLSDRRMIYTADDERIVISEGQTTRYRVRDLSPRVLREWKSTGGSLEWERDYLYAGGDLVAGEVQIDQSRNGLRHYHTDHLGSVRMVTDGAGELVSRHDYLPFGAEIPPTTSEHANTGKAPRDPLKFTGHERDYFSAANVDGEYVDYMHARYYAPTWGRFLSVDPIISRSVVRLPQGWNRYSYALNNPLRFTDPTGMKVECHTVPASGDSPEQVICAESIDVEGDVPKTPSIGGSISSLFDLMNWAGGNLPRESAADSRSARDLSNTPVMDQIREQYKKNKCVDREKPYYGDFQYGELVTTPPFSTGQMVGSFGADIRGIGNGQVVVKAFNTWGLESATRLPGASNRGNASVQQMLGGAPLQYPKSILENRSGGPGGTATLNYIWMEGSPCGQ